VLQNAVDNGGNYAAYYLGCLYYDKLQWEKSVELWEGCADKITLPTVYRNLSLAYYNKQGNAEKAREAMEKAFNMDKTDARIFFELDQLYRVLNLSLKERLDNMNANAAILEKRDDLYTEYITLLNMNGEYENAYERIMSHNFHPWEGGEGKIPAQYRIALMNMAKKADTAKAIEMLEKALVYHYNLGEGKLIGNLDNDIYYMLGNLYEDEAKKKQAFELAARGEFELTSAMYYNDRPPEMTYYAAKAIEALGDSAEAQKRFDAFIDYANAHMDDDIKIEYFAVSLPDFLIYEADLNKKNKVHCLYMAALGYLGKGDTARAKEYAEKGLELNKCHAGLMDIVR
ncbi:MAG: tetratricopeptide repeat protein, partial [Clostridia bacterium]|nr:tetratricopeptide repeat protein [Clostridia bacterium]